jgi:hypothetical protein
VADLGQLNQGDVITMRVYKSLASNPLLEWANTYEFALFGTAPGYEDLNAFATAIVGAEALMHLSDVVYSRVVTSSWVADGEPYNPASFVVTEMGGLNGIRPQSSDPLPLSSCFQVKRNVSFGRSGRSLYRRVLQESDVEAPAGSQVIRNQDLPFYVTLVEAVQLAMFSAASLNGFQHVMAARYGNDPTIRVREVTGLQAVKPVSIKKTNNRYFDLRVA